MTSRLKTALSCRGAADAGVHMAASRPHLAVLSLQKLVVKNARDGRGCNNFAPAAWRPRECIRALVEPTWWRAVRGVQVAQVQRNFIELLVQKGLFARQLSALREVDSMLRHVEALKGNEHDQLLQATMQPSCMGIRKDCCMQRVGNHAIEMRSSPQSHVVCSGH